MAEPEKALVDYFYFVALGKKAPNERLNVEFFAEPIGGNRNDRQLRRTCQINKCLAMVREFMAHQILCAGDDDGWFAREFLVW